MPASKEELSAAMNRIFDALNCMRGPSVNGRPAELIYVGEKAMHMAWHLARAGVDVHPERAVIKARAPKAGIGQLPGMVDWVPVDMPDRVDEPQPVSACGPDIDLADLDDRVPWHVKTKIQGAFQ
jgi:hypothetical protein